MRKTTGKLEREDLGFGIWREEKRKTDKCSFHGGERGKPGDAEVEKEEHKQKHVFSFI